MTEHITPFERRETPQDRGDVLGRLRGIDGELLRHPLPERILDNRNINTVVVFSGEAGSGKSTIVGQLTEKFAAKNVRTYHVFTEDAIAQTEEELNKRRSDWGAAEYTIMSDNLLRLTLREKERMRDEADEGRSILLVETMALPAADGFDRGQSALLGLEDGSEDTFYVGVPSDPRVQNHASDVRTGAQDVLPKDIFDYLRSKNITVSGIPEETEVLGQAVKDVLGKQATRHRLEWMRDQITTAATRWAKHPQIQEFVHSVGVPPEGSEEYRKKIAYMEHVLRQYYFIPPERGMIVANPFDAQQSVDWNVAPFLRTEEEISIDYLYPPLLAASRVFTHPEESRAVLAEEALAIARGKKTPDFLEILPGKTIVECLKIMRETLREHPDALTNPPTSEEHLPFETHKKRAVGQLIARANVMVQHGSLQSKELLSPKNRKALGMISSGKEIVALAEAMEAVFNQDEISPEGELVLVHMFGSFDPFPHTGHQAVAREAYRAVSNEVPEGVVRIECSTFDTNPLKQATEGTFSQRFGNLQRGFSEENSVTVLGMPGDNADVEKRKKQIELLASFDKDGKFRRVCGSDVFEVQLARAKAEDKLSQFLLQASHPLYIVPRSGHDREALATKIADATATYGAEIIVLGEINNPASGTEIRSLPTEQRIQYRPSRFILEL